MNGRYQYRLRGTVSRSKVTRGWFLPAPRPPVHTAVIINLSSAWHIVEIWEMCFPSFLSCSLPLLGQHHRTVILSVGSVLEDRPSLSYLTASQAKRSVYPKSSTSVPLPACNTLVPSGLFLLLYALLILLC